MRRKYFFRQAVGFTAFAFLATIVAATVFVSASAADTETDRPHDQALLSSAAPNNRGFATDKTQEGTAIVEVITEPALCNGSRLRFSGVPSGQITLDGCEPGEPAPVRRLTSAAVPSGTVESTLTYIDPVIRDLGYRLSAIRCDDDPSDLVSIGDMEAKKASFGIDSGETVTCTFVLSAGSPCTCPKAGRWKVTNNTGLMACRGSFNHSNPLRAGTTRGTIEIRDDCGTLYAEGMSDSEAPITFRRTPQCTYKGSVGQEQFGVDLTINFTLEVENEERMTGALTSTVSEQGTTCNMDRTYEMDFIGQ